MKRLLRWLVIIAVLVGAGWASSGPITEYLKERSRVNYREIEITRGRIVSVVNSTGTVKPVRLVQVGAFVSGPVKEIYVDFNSVVTKDQLLAKIDPVLYQANVARDKALLATRMADVQRAEALLQQAVNDFARAEALRAENKSFISDAEMDQFKFNRMSLEAQLLVAKTSVDQAQANLENSLANLSYTEIRSPEDGVIIDRKIDRGQTVAASFQTPDLFVVAPDMKKRMFVYASVDEADIGLIKDAQDTEQPVKFTVDAYPDDLFEGKIFQVRMSATVTQNVVTYPVIVEAPNPDLKLRPSMTASISFQLREKENVLRVPNAALRFFPQKEQVRAEDRHLFDVRTPAAGEVDDQGGKAKSAEDKAELRRKRNRRHVWLVDGDFLRAVEVVTGMNDNTYTEVVAGDLKEGEKVVTGVAPKS